MHLPFVMLFGGCFVALFYSFFLLLLFCDIKSIFSIMFGLLFLFCMCIYYRVLVYVYRATYFHKKYRKRQKYNKKLTTVSLFKANQGKNSNIPLQVLSNIYISVIKMFICIVSFLLLTLIYYHKLTNIFFFTGYINIHLLLH